MHPASKLCGIVIGELLALLLFGHSAVQAGAPFVLAGHSQIVRRVDRIRIRGWYLGGRLLASRAWKKRFRNERLPATSVRLDRSTKSLCLFCAR